jgi:hypothetical protein
MQRMNKGCVVGCMFDSRPQFEQANYARFTLCMLKSIDQFPGWPLLAALALGTQFFKVPDLSQPPPASNAIAQYRYSSLSTFTPGGRPGGKSVTGGPRVRRYVSTYLSRRFSTGTIKKRSLGLQMTDAGARLYRISRIFKRSLSSS